MARAPQKRRQLVALAVRLFVLVLVVWSLWRTLQAGVARLERSDWRADVGWLVAAGVFYILGLLPAGLFWRQLLAALGEHPPLGATLRAYYIGHLGKYVPGKAMVLVLRSGLLLDRGVRAPVAVVSVFLETLTMMAVGAFLAATIGAMILRDQRGVVLGGVLLMVAAGAPTLPPILQWLLRRRWMALWIGGPEPMATSPPSPERERESEPAEIHSPHTRDVPHIGWRLIALGWMLNVVGWFVLGISLWAVLRALRSADAAPLAELPHYTAAVALAMVAGFVSGLPGGIGVRDGILIAVLATTVPEHTAIVASVMLRLDWLLSELLVSGMLYFVGTRGRGSEHAPPARPQAPSSGTPP